MINFENLVVLSHILPQFTDRVTYLTSLIALTDFRIDKNLIEPSLNGVICAGVSNSTFLADKRKANGIGTPTE